MMKIQVNTTNTATVCARYDHLAKLSQDKRFVEDTFLLAVKFDIVASKEATNASSTKKCPILPMSRCSPSKCMNS